MLTRSGMRVIIFTVMAGDPPIGFQPREYTHSLHKRWKLTDDTAVSGRRKEDSTAAKMLGAEVKFGPYPDAVYRINPHDNSPLYPDDSAIFGTVHEEDPVKEARRAAVIQAVM